MHRGSSKAVGGPTPTTDNLPLSAPPLAIEVEVVRAGRSQLHRLSLPAGSLIRDAVRQVGLSPEGAAVLVGEVPVPLDLPLDRPLRLTVVPTFSGG